MFNQNSEPYEESKKEDLEVVKKKKPVNQKKRINLSLGRGQIVPRKQALN